MTPEEASRPTPMPPLQPLSRADSVALGRRRRLRNIVLLLVLVAVAALFYAIAIVKLTPGTLSGGG